MAESKDMMSKISEHVSAYKSACEDHPDLKAFDSSLQQKTIKVVDSLTAKAENETLSIHDLHMEVSEHLHEVTGALANFILESKTDVWENEDLRSLVKAYFDNTGKTLDILNTVMASVEDAERGQLVILEAVELFDKESSEKDGGKKKSYVKTLKKLKKFKAMGDPFDGQVLQTQFQLINKQNESLMEEVTKLKTKVQEDCNNKREEIKISNAIVGASIATVVVGAMATMTTVEIVGVSIAAIPLGVVLVGLGWLGYTAWKHHEEKEEAEVRLKGQEEALKKLEVLENVLKALDKGVVVNKEETKTVSILVNQLETKINSIVYYVDDAIEDEEDDVDPTLVLNRIKEKVNDVTSKIKEVGKKVAECSRLIMEAKTKVDEKIVRYRAEA